MPRLLNSQFAGRMVRPMGGRRSDYITTRCYSPDGTQLWDGDHGNDVFALAVGADGIVYQSGAEYSASNTGDSLFHRYADSLQPLVTAMAFGGRPIWSIKKADGFGSSYGIAAGTNGYVYCGINSATPYLAKLDAGDGDDVLHLPITDFIRAFNAPPSTTPPFVSADSNQSWGRVRVDGSNNVYAIGATDGNTASNIFKWVSDEEFHLLDEQQSAYYAPTGLGVSSAGVIATSSAQPSGAYPDDIPMFYVASLAAGNLSPAAFSTYTARQSNPNNSGSGYFQVGTSPDGTRNITYDGINGQVISVAATGDPEVPTVTTLVSLAALGGSVFVPYTAMAVNDDGVYCYSIPRGTLTPDGTHDIRAADNSLIARLDHGGAIYDAVVLADGSVIVAGERVARADFP